MNNGFGLNAFVEAGLHLHLSAESLHLKLSRIKLLLFDWDGVFNNGSKISDKGSGFSEIDSLGLNLLRYGLWLRNQKMPVAVVLSGAKNDFAIHFAEREHFNAVYTNYKDKSAALDRLLDNYGISEEHVAFFFDDVLDLGVAARCGIRVFFGRHHSPALAEFVENENLADILPAKTGGQNALREIADLMLCSLEKYPQVLSDRMSLSTSYLTYWEERQFLSTIVNEFRERL